MHVMIGDKIYNSADAPIMILFNQTEISQFRAATQDDIFCAWPSSWDSFKGLGWMSLNRDKLITEANGKNQKNLMEKIYKMDPNSLKLLDDKKDKDLKTENNNEKV